jgi:regulatory protein
MEYTITAIKAQKRNPQRVALYLDGSFAFGLSRIVAAWLNVGKVLSDADIESLKAQDTQEVVYQAAVNFISYRPRSTAEVEERLTRKGYESPVIAQTIERLHQNGLLNDAQFAQAWVENRNTFRPRSQRALSYELRKKGVAAEVIEQTLDTSTDEENLAYQAALRQSRKYAHEEWPVFRVKLGAFLMRRGFSYQTIAPVVTRVWSGLNRESGDTE